MRALPLVLLVLAGSLLPGTASAACTGSDITLRNDGNTLWVSDWRCDGDPEERSNTVRADVFWPLSTTGTMTLVAVTSTSKVDHGEVGSYARTDTLVVTTAGRESSAHMTTSEDTSQRMTCTLSVTAAGIGAARNAPLPVCVPGDAVLL